MKKPQEKAMHPLHRHRRHCIALAGAAAALWLSPALAQGKTAARKILILGDSLSAEYGLARGTGWVTLLEQRLAQQHPNASVVNASISGETAGGRSRLPALLKQHQPQIVVIELGGNDALRGLPLQQTEDLRLMLQVSESGAKGLLVGMQMPPTTAPATGVTLPRSTPGWRRTRARRWCRSCSKAWPIFRMPPRCSRPTASTPCRSPAADAGQRLAHRGLLG
jgi:acyl-CoA thioesterase-1